MGEYRDHYEIPKEIKDQIPESFYYALWGECVSIFGKSVMEAETYSYPPSDGEPYEPLYGLAYITSSVGWNRALFITCKKLDLMQVYEYYEALPWFDSDRFDSEIEMEMYKHVPGTKGNPYYQYLASIPFNVRKELEDG